MFEPRFEDLFERDDAVVRDLLGSLEGDVLDIGAGEGRYDDVLRRRVQDGRIRYRALEPDRGAAQRRRARWPDVEIETVAAEAWRPDPHERVDHILIVRSWNHLVDPAAVLTRVRAVARPGASLTVVDNVVFGLARTPAQTQRARNSTAGFEHRRNDDASVAHRQIASCGFELVQRVDVGPGTSNQWLLRYRLAEQPC
jgi:SAM-dependent methyltransferase